MSFYLSLFLFIISLIIGLALMIVGKNMSREKFLLLVSIHVIFLFAFIASLLLKKNGEVNTYNYFFTAFVCTGIILSGLSWRSTSPMILRFYFSIFVLTIPLFLVSPSILLNFLLTMNFSSTHGPSFHLDKQYYLETQNTSTVEDKKPHYKVILKRGLFHQTIKRDIVFGGKLDSLKIIDKNTDKSIKVRGYSSKTTYVSLEVDSVDILIPLKITKQGDVEYRLN